VGEPEYDLASIGIFFASGDPGVLGAVLDGWGRPRDDGLALRVMTWALLHRYSRLSWYLDLVPPRPGVRTLEDLASQWFAT
jgi:hygromycin-B 7''-O-kinase